MPNAIGSVKIIHTALSGIERNLSTALDASSCYIETKDLDGDNQHMFKYLQQIYAAIENLESAPNLRFIIKWRNSLAEPLQSSSPMTFSQTQNTSFRVPGARFYRLRIEDIGLAVVWKIHKLEMFGTIGGRRA